MPHNWQFTCTRSYGKEWKKRRRTTRVRRIETEKFRITHPFHPLTGREFEAVARKEHGGEHRVCFLDKKGRRHWHRLLEICAITDTLILDEDGIYHPTDFNDARPLRI